MNIVQIIDDVTSWAQENICNIVQLKVPPTEDTEPIDGQYEYELAHPSAFALYVPSKDKLPENLKSEIPYLSVRRARISLTPEAVEAAVSRCNLSCVPGILDSIAKTSLDTRAG